MPFIWSFWTSPYMFTMRVSCWPIVPGTLHISIHDGVNDKDLSDDGLGNLSGDGTGIVDYGYGLIAFNLTVPFPVTGTEVRASYDSAEGGCFDICSACPTNKIRLNLTPASIIGQGEIAVNLAWSRLMTKIRRDVLPAHVEILSDAFEEEYILHVGHRFDYIEADSETLDVYGISLIFDSTIW